MRLVSMLALLLSLSVFAGAAEPKQYQFQIKVFEGTLGKKEAAKVISEPQVVTTDKRPFTLRVGSEVVLPKAPGDNLTYADYGLGMHGKATLIDPETVRLELQWQNAELVTSNDEELEIKTTGIRLSRAVKLGKMSTIVLSKETEKQIWAEFMITEAQTH